MPHNKNIETFEEYLQIYGLIESKGQYFQKYIRKIHPQKITQKNMDDIMMAINNGKIDSYEGRIKDAIPFFNKVNENFMVYGRERPKGCIFINKNSTKEESKNLQKDPVYKTFLMSYLSILADKGSVNMNMLRAWEELEFPLAFLTFIDTAIQDKIVIRFEYFSDRKQATSQVERFVPVKLNFQDKYWFLIGRKLDDDIWIQYLLYGIKNVVPVLDKDGNFEKCKHLPKFDLKKFYENTFGSAMLNYTDPVTITLQIPKGYRNAISKRHNDIGKWVDDETWEITTCAPNEVIDFVFKWGGHIKILSPDTVIKQFKERLKVFNEQYKKKRNPNKQILL
ncbi:MAG: WYL domain-containing protein [Leptospiraceae bacterium]|nr:WYL domain-containing protein [Leptospiraceae bacterium]